jgi:hypothetical protein
VVWWHACAQCEALMASLAHPEAGASRPAAQKGSSAEARLGSAVGAENDTFIASEGDRQQLLLRRALSGSRSYAACLTGMPEGRRCKLLPAGHNLGQARVCMDASFVAPSCP